MGVIDGQSVSASITNAAFLSKNAADSTAYNLSLGAALNFPKNVIATAGTINALDSTKLNVKLTGASVILNGALSGSDGQVMIVYAGNSTPVVINSLSGSASAANQFKLTAPSYTLAAGSAAIFVYDSTLANWVIVGTMDDVSATSANTASTIVKRDASGNFSAGTITASLSGSATSFTGSLAGDVTGNQGSTVVSAVGTSSAANVHAAELLANAATSLNTYSAIIKRDSGGSFIASTANLNAVALTGSISGTPVTIAANATTAAYNLTLPAAQGTASTTLVNDGTGALTWGSSGGGGGGAKNYFTLSSANPSFENSTISPWSLCTLTLSSGVPSGAPTLSATQMALATTATNPLIGTKSGQLTKSAANAQGQGFISGALTIDREDTAKILSGSFSYEVVSGAVDFSGTSTQSLEIWIYNTVSGAWTQPAGYRGMNQSSGQGRVIFNFQTDGSTANNGYKIAIITAQTSTTAFVVNFDDFQIGPQQVNIGPVVTDWASYTPTWGVLSGSAPAIGNGTLTGKYRRVGDSGYYQIALTFGTTTTIGSGVYTFSLFSGQNIDYTKMNITSGSNDDQSIQGGGTIVKNGTNRWAVRIANIAGLASNQVAMEIWHQSGTTTANTPIPTNIAVTNAIPATWANTDTFTIEFGPVPIVGWSSNVQMSSDSYQGIVAASANGNANLAITANAAIPFTTVLFDTNGITTIANGRFTIPVSGYYTVSLNAYARTTGTGGTFTMYKNGSANTGILTLGVAASYFSGSSAFYFNAGDYFDIRSDASLTLLAGYQVSTQRISGPSVLAATETTACRYTDTSGQSITSTASVMKFATKDFDTTNSYNTSTGLFTVPLSGKYSISPSIFTANVLFSTTQYLELYIYKNGSQYCYLGRSYGNGQTQPTQYSGFDIIPCNAGDTLAVYAFASTATTMSTAAGANHLEILRVGN